MINQLALAGLVPVIKVERAEDAVPLCRALAAGGLPVAEITFRTDAAEEAIRRVHAELPDVMLGAGTVLGVEQADRAIAAGAGYIVTPGFNSKVVNHCLQQGYPVLPGCAGPSDIEAALELGLKAVKFFPAEALGGVKTLKALLGPYHMMHFVPTGGINEGNLKDYLSIPQVLACGGSWMVPDDAIKSADWGKIEQLTRAAVQQVLGLELRHVGLNHPDAKAGMATAELLSQLTGWPILRDSERGCFVGDGFEVMKLQGRGTYGHIALAANDLPRAKWHLERRGFQFDEDSLELDATGRPRLIYIKDEVAGFGIHLSQK